MCLLFWKIKSCCIFISLLCIPFSVAGKSSKKNVVLIVADDLRPSLGCYDDGLAYTPHIDALASKSFLFTHVYAQQALCGPSRTSFLTSRYPHSLGQYDVHQYWRQSVGNFTSLPQFFKERGYYTASFGKVFHPGKCSNFSDDQPYSWSEIPFHPSTERYKNSAVCPHIISDKGLSRSVVCPVDLKVQPEGTLPDIQTLQASLRFIQNHKETRKDQLFFLAVGFHKPHIPLKFPLHYLRYHPEENIALPALRVRPPGIPASAWNPWLDLKERDDIHSLNITFPWGSMPDKWAIRVKQSYYASISYIDNLIGTLMKELEIKGLMNNTVIIFTSDHGWSLGEHGEWSKYSNYEVATRVPLLIHVPGMEHGRQIHSLVELIDLYPTIVDLSGVSNIMPKCSEKDPEIFCTEGRSLEPLMKSHKSAIRKWRDTVLSIYPRPSQYPSQHPNSDQPKREETTVMGFSIRTVQHRYTAWVSFDPLKNLPNWSHIYGSELYDHFIDDDENLNLSGREALKSLETFLLHQLQSLFNNGL